MDEMSAEAQFAKLKKPEDTKKSILKKEKLIKNNKKNNLNKSDEDESSDEKDIKAKSKKTYKILFSFFPLKIILE